MAGGEKIRCGTAPSGVKYALRRSSGQVAWCALSIGAGTRDEDGFPAGIAHFTEHNLFRGTSRKSARVISSYLDRLGGELNAFTTKEEIVLHATVLKELHQLYWLDLKGNKNLKTFDVTGCTQYFEHCEFEVTKDLVYYTFRQQVGVTNYSDPGCQHSKHIIDNRQTTDWSNQDEIRYFVPSEGGEEG